MNRTKTIKKTITTAVKTEGKLILCLASSMVKSNIIKYIKHIMRKKPKRTGTINLRAFICAVLQNTAKMTNSPKGYISLWRKITIYDKPGPYRVAECRKRIVLICCVLLSVVM